ncbi:MAG: NAD(P)H-hydrate dehydratase, partial [Campylobacterota bacterium]
KTQTFVLQKSDFYPPYRIGRASHKGDFGHVNVLCGQKQGAGILAAQAAMNFGAGLVSLVTNESVQIPPFLMKDTHVSKNCTALAVGMGLGSEFLDQFLQSEVVDKTCRVVLDADGLDNKTLLTLLDQSSREVVLTPHPKEFSRLLAHTGIKKSVSEIQAERFETAREFSRAYPHTVLVLKGTYTLIAKDGQVYVNPFASARLSQGGSGDVLSGLIVSLLGQGYSAKEAAITGSLALSFAAGKFEGADYAMDAGDLVRLLKSELV